MQTDAYDPEALSLYLSAERDREAAAAGLAAALADDDFPRATAPSDAVDLPPALSEEPGPTAPIDLDGWTDAPWRTDRSDAESSAKDAPGLDVRGDAAAADGADAAAADDAVAHDDEEDAARASRAALRRWGVTGDNV